MNTAARLTILEKVESASECEDGFTHRQHMTWVLNTRKWRGTTLESDTAIFGAPSETFKGKVSSGQSEE